MDKAKVIILSVAMFLLALGLVLVGYDNRKRKRKVVAGSPEQMKQARQAKADRATDKLVDQIIADEFTEAKIITVEPHDKKGLKKILDVIEPSANGEHKKAEILN